MIGANLIPAERLSRNKRNARLRIWAIVCGTYAALLAIAFAVGYSVSNRDDQAVSQRLEAVNQKIEQSSSSINVIKAELAEARAAYRASQAVGSQPDWSALLVLLSGKLGDQIVLDTCDLSPVKDADRPGSTAAGKQAEPQLEDVPLAQRRYELNLSGFGRSQTAVSKFVLRLEKIDLFSEVKLTKSSREPFIDGPAVAFRIECSI